VETILLDLKFEMTECALGFSSSRVRVEHLSDPQG
jgi:hypothetical protein